MWDWRSQESEDRGAVPLAVSTKCGVEDRALCVVTQVRTECREGRIENTQSEVSEKEMRPRNEWR